MKPEPHAGWLEFPRPLGTRFIIAYACPACGRVHRHHVHGDEWIGSVVNRGSHCPKDPDGGVYICIVAEDFPRSD